MSKVGIKNNDPEGIWKWLEYLEELSEKIQPGGGKSLTQMRKKFLDGFPEWFDVVITSERLKPDPGSYVIPRHYPTHHPKAGQEHPKRGQPDMQAMALALSPEWTRRCKKIKSAPRGSVYAVESQDDDDDDSSVEYADVNAVSRGAINASFICLICGGCGHAGSVDGMDCLTKQLGISIPRQELAATKYPNGLKYPNMPRSKSASARYSQDSDGESINYSQRNGKFRQTKPKVKFRSKKEGKKPHVKRKSVRQDESEASEEESKQRNETVESSDSDGEVAAKFAVTYHTIDTSGQYNSM